MTDQPKLKPCPFCNKTDEVDCEYAVNCVGCKRCDVEMIAPTKEEAIAKWNARPSPWIPVGERLPDPDTRVLMSCPLLGGHWFLIDRLTRFSHGTTHWMDLPEAP